MNIEARLRIVIEPVNPDKRWKTLEDITGVSSSSWQNFWREKQRPTAAMIEGICKNWPQYAFWIGTGCVDKEGGHVAPPGIEATEIVRNSVTTMCINQ